MKALVWNIGRSRSQIRNPGNPGRASWTRAREYREKLLEAAAECDEALMDKYLNGEEAFASRNSGGASKRLYFHESFPVTCGASFKNKGVQPMLDAIVDFLPSPLDVPPVEGRGIPTMKQRSLTRQASFRAVFRARFQDHE